MSNQTQSEITFHECQDELDFAAALELTKVYINWLDIDLSFQKIDHEIENFSTMYNPPSGLFILAMAGDQVAGGVGLRWLESGFCEMKRLYVYDHYKGLGIGAKLCERLILRAAEMGYWKMRLDTLGKMQSAQNLYQSLGFTEIAPYRYNPDPDTRYLELALHV